MKSILSTAAGVLLAVSAPLAAAQSMEEMLRAMAQAQAELGTQAETGAAGDMPEVVVLSDGQVRSYIEMLEAMKSLGLKMDRMQAGGDISQQQALAASTEMQDIMHRNGFTPESLSQVGYSIAMALAADETSQAELAESRAEQAEAMIEMKAMLSPAQYEMMKAQMDQAMSVMEDMADQPPQNIALAAKYRAELEAAHE